MAHVSQVSHGMPLVVAFQRKLIMRPAWHHPDQLAEAGDILLPMKEGTINQDHLAGELGEVVLGTVVGRRSPGEITIFKSLGMAVEDVAAAHLAYVKAAERGLGRGFVL